MGECRNCGGEKTKDLGFVGEVAPFFLKRVLNLEYGLAPSERSIKRALRKIGTLSKIFQKIYAKSVLVEMQICERCSFVQTKTPFQDEAIGNLYADYRSDSYNQERIRYEPEYAPIAAHVGSGIQEVQTRRVGLTRWLKGKLNPETGFSMLDYGGANGVFLPELPGSKYVFDISDIAPADGVTRIKSESELVSYSYIQLAHVLEHVPFPLALTKKAASFLEDSGCLYIEVPRELDDSVRMRLERGDATIHLPIHEHINQYNVSSVTELLRSAGLASVVVQSEIVDLGWCEATIIRALGRKC
jgi:Methyltransferase domain